MACASAGSGESSNNSSIGSGWYPQVVTPKRNGFERRKAAVVVEEEEPHQPDFEEEISMASLGGGPRGGGGTVRFCRLCLSKEQQLKPLFPPDGAPDETLLNRILQCLTIELCFDEDYDTFVCKVCVQEVTKFFMYKEQCLANDAIIRGRLRPAKVGYYGDDEPKEPIPFEDDDEEDEDEQNFEPIDSDEFDIPNEEDHENQSDNPMAMDVEDDPSEDMPTSDLALEPWKLKPLPKTRNRRENVQDYFYGGYRYTCAATRANGKVHWRCMFKSKLKCRAAILVSPNGTVNTGTHRHNHQPDKKKTNPEHAGGTILDVYTGQKVTYQLITSQRSKIHPTQMVCNGYKYRYARSTQKQTTYWRCMKHNGKENCKAILSFRTDFSTCSSNGHPHNHPAQYDISKPLPASLLVEEPQPEDTNGSEKRISQKEFLKGRRKNVKVHNGYEYGYPRIDRQYSRWACFKKSLFNCPANLITNAAGKVIKESDWAHNHGPNDDYATETIIEGYMTDSKTNEQVYYKLIPGKRGQRFVLYRGYRYSSDRFMSDGRMAWKCTKCRVFIIIEGRFSSFEERGIDHEHPVLEEDDEALDMGACLKELPGTKDGEMEFGVKKELEDDDEGEDDEGDGEEEEDDDQDAFASDDDQLIVP